MNYFHQQATKCKATKFYTQHRIIYKIGKSNFNMKYGYIGNVFCRAHEKRDRGERNG